MIKPTATIAFRRLPRIERDWSSPARASGSLGIVKPRRLAEFAITLPHPVHAGPRGVFVAPADVAIDHLCQLVPKIFAQRVSAVSEVVQGAVTRGQRHVQGSEAGTFTTQHIQ